MIGFDEIQRIPGDCTDLIVLTVQQPVAIEHLAQTLGELSEMFPASAEQPHRVMVLTGGMRLLQLSDESLRRVGLKRIDPSEQEWRKLMGADD